LNTSFNARVVANERDLLKIEFSDNQKEVLASISGKLRFSSDEFPIVGDFVSAEAYTGPSSEMAVITAIAPRKTLLTRATEHGSDPEQNIAANVDEVLIVTSLNQDLNLRRLERMMVLVWNAGCLPVIVLTKSDLGMEVPQDFAGVAAGVPVVQTSIYDADSIHRLLQVMIPGKTYAMIGSSGVGKSTLVNALIGTAIPTNAVRPSDDRGRHTTTNRRLYRLHSGAFLVDSPGIRTVALPPPQATTLPIRSGSALDSVFGEVELLTSGCKYSNCTHSNEDGCLIQKAISDGRLTIDRWNSYGKLQREIAFRERKSSAQLQAEEKKKWKNINKQQRARSNFYKKTRET